MKTNEQTPSPTAKPLAPVPGSAAPIPDSEKAKLKAAIKPLVLEMYPRGWTSVTVEFIRGIATMTVRQNDQADA